MRAIRVLVRRTASGELQITFRLDGDISRIRIPSPATPRVATQLWQHTCFEAFIAVEGRTAYHEFNFAPSGEWAVHAFRGYRDGGSSQRSPTPPSTSRCAQLTGGLSSRLVSGSNSLSAIHATLLRIGLSAVIEAGDGRFRTGRFAIGPRKPDFHDANGFALLLEPPGAVR